MAISFQCIGVADDCTDCDGDDVAEQVSLAAIDARVFETQMTLEADGGCGHASPP